MSKRTIIDELFAMDERDSKAFRNAWRLFHSSKKQPPKPLENTPDIPYMDEGFLNLEDDALLNQMALNVAELSKKRRHAGIRNVDGKMIRESMANTGALDRARKVQ